MTPFTNPTEPICFEVIPSALKALRDEHEQQMEVLKARAVQENRTISSFPRAPEIVLQNIVNKLTIGPGDCWIWDKPKDRDGYPIIYCGKKNWRGARLVLFLTCESFGSKPIAMHSCDNPSCLNPAHLSEGTAKDNRYDCIQKGRTNYNAHKKLTVEQVAFIRAEYRWRTPGRTIYALAERFRVCPTAIWAIISRTNWKSAP